MSISSPKHKAGERGDIRETELRVIARENNSEFGRYVSPKEAPDFLLKKGARGIERAAWRAQVDELTDADRESLEAEKHPFEAQDVAGLDDLSDISGHLRQEKYSPNSLIAFAQQQSRRLRERESAVVVDHDGIAHEGVLFPVFSPSPHGGYGKSDQRVGMTNNMYPTQLELRLQRERRERERNRIA